MKVNIIEVGTTVLKDSSSYDYIKALTHVQKFGKSSLELITVKVPSKSAYKIGEFDVNIALPFSEYPYTLNS